MSETLVVIRSTTIGERETNLANQLLNLNLFRVLAVLDATGAKTAVCTNGVEPFDDALVMTDDWVQGEGLHHARAEQTRGTGWLCGDYVFYRILELNWDYAWVVEPDVFFLNGGQRIFTDTASFTHDVIASNIGLADDWYWATPFNKLVPEMAPARIDFPLVRVSRKAAEKSLELRREISRRLDGREVLIPNDESVVGSTLFQNKLTFLDMADRWPELFQYWSTNAKFNVDDLAQLESSPLIVHSGKRVEEYLECALSIWEKANNGWSGQAEYLFESLRGLQMDSFNRLCKAIGEKLQ